MLLTEAGNSFAWGNGALRFHRPGLYRTSMRFGAMGHATTGVLGAAWARGGKAVAVWATGRC